MSYLEMVEPFLWNLSRNIQPKPDIWDGKFQPKCLNFGKVIGNGKQGLITGSVRQS